MTEKLQEQGLEVGHRRVGGLMQHNGIKVVRTLKYKATTIARQANANPAAENGYSWKKNTVAWHRIRSFETAEPPADFVGIEEPT